MFNFNILLISIISTIIFGIIDATIFLIGEETIQKILIQKFNFDLTMAELATGGFATFLSKNIETKYKIIEHTIIDAFGIILGTIFIILIYNFF